MIMTDSDLELFDQPTPPMTGTEAQQKYEATLDAGRLRKGLVDLAGLTQKRFDKIRELGSLRKKIWDQKQWTMLGYKSWPDYCTGELDSKLLKLPDELCKEIAVDMRSWGASQKDIAVFVNRSQPGVSNILAGLTAAEKAKLPSKTRTKTGGTQASSKKEGSKKPGPKKATPETPTPAPDTALPDMPAAGTPAPDIRLATLRDLPADDIPSENVAIVPRVTIQGEATQVTLEEIRDNLKAAQELKDTIAAELTPDNVTLEYAAMLNQHASWIHHWANDMLNMINPDSQADTDTESMKWNHSGSVPFQSEDDMISPDL